MEAPWNNPNVNWVCEDHPDQKQGHFIKKYFLFWPYKVECGGAGMMDEKSRRLYGELPTPEPIEQRER